MTVATQFLLFQSLFHPSLLYVCSSGLVYCSSRNRPHLTGALRFSSLYSTCVSNTETLCLDITAESSKGSKAGLVSPPSKQSMRNPQFFKASLGHQFKYNSVVVRMCRGSPPGINTTAQMFDMRIGTLVFTLNDKVPPGMRISTFALYVSPPKASVSQRAWPNRLNKVGYHELHIGILAY